MDKPNLRDYVKNIHTDSAGYGGYAKACEKYAEFQEAQASTLKEDYDKLLKEYKRDRSLAIILMSVIAILLFVFK